MSSQPCPPPIPVTPVDMSALSLPARLLHALVRGYRLLLSPWLGSSCRFEPTCSAYALRALECHGALAGSRLTLWRIARCNPWCEGGCDPVPERARPGLFTSLVDSSPTDGSGAIARSDNPIPVSSTDLRKKAL